jgi:hypothetical protein
MAWVTDPPIQPNVVFLVMTTMNTNQQPARLREVRRFQVYRLERRQSRSLLSRLSHGLRLRFHR